MKKFIMPPASGKTQKLIELSHKTGAYIVCRSMDLALDIQTRALKDGYNIPLPLSYSEFVRNDYSIKLKGVLIDDLDSFIEWIAGVPVLAITMEGKYINSDTDE